MNESTFDISTGDWERIKVSPSAIKGLVYIAPEHQNDDGTWEVQYPAYSISPEAAGNLGAALVAVARGIQGTEGGRSQ